MNLSESFNTNNNNKNIEITLINFKHTLIKKLIIIIDKNANSIINDDFKRSYMKNKINKH